MTVSDFNWSDPRRQEHTNVVPTSLTSLDDIFINKPPFYTRQFLTMDFFLPTVLALLLLGPAHYLFRVYRNYRIAKSTGLPVVFTPWSPTNPFSYLLSGFARDLATRLGVGHWLRYAYYGWDVQERSKPFEEMGCTAFILVSPGRNWLYVVDPDIVTALYAGERRGEITRPAEGVKMLDVFGPNITTVGFLRSHRRWVGKLTRQPQGPRPRLAAHAA